MTRTQKTLAAILAIIAFVALLLIGVAVHMAGTAAFLGAMVMAVLFEMAQRLDRRWRAHRR